MNKVPSIISTKDLSYIEDIFHWNYTASKKAKQFSEEVDDIDVVNKLNEVVLMHNEICERLINILR